MIDSGYRLRAVTMEDADVLLAWRNDEQTRRWSRQHELVSRDEHLQWLQRRLADPRSLQWVAEGIVIPERVAVPVGIVRYELDLRREQGEVSITVAPQSRGKGVAGRLLAQSEPLLRTAVPDLALLVAHVHSAHEASLRLFEGAGYRRVTETPDAHGYLRLRRHARTRKSAAVVR